MHSSRTPRYFDRRAQKGGKDLDGLTAERLIAQADPEPLLLGAPPILIDEWQCAPRVRDAVKIDVDNHNQGGRFLLT